MLGRKKNCLVKKAKVMLHFSPVDYKALPMILTQAARSLSVLLVIAALSAQESKDSLLTKVAPILAGRPEHGVTGATTGTERWIVHFEQRSFELTDFRAAILSRRPAAEVTAIVTGLVAQVKKDQAAFVTAVQSIGGNVVQQWWLVNAAAVEILPTQLLFLRQLPNVSYVQPDELCEMAIITATNPSNHNADDLQAQGYVGLGVAVGIVDTGQDSSMNGTTRPHRVYFPNGNPALTTGGGIGGSRLLVNRQIGAQSADDTNGHGTGVASISAGANWGTSGADDGHAPMAGICGYAIAELPNGSSYTTTQASGWQQLAADRATYNIVSANMSYLGSPNPLDLAQQAIDSAALNADVLCCVAAGNSGASTTNSCGAANAIAVGALNATTHTVATFSSRGFLSGDSGRFYPDISACGVNTAMALLDNEGGNFVGSGTSMASPQVTGAAAQLRARFPFLTAVQTKAVLLASYLDISAQNPGLNRNDFGMGMLRNDFAHSLVASGGVGTGSAVTTAPAQFGTFTVIAGHSYQASIAWHRLDLNSTSWSNLDLAVLDPNGTIIGQSTSPRNLYEVVHFVAGFNGIATLRVTAVTVGGASAQPYAWAGTEVPTALVTGTAAGFGTGCSAIPPLCNTINPNGGTLAPLTQASEFAYEMVAATNLKVVAMDVFLSTSTPLIAITPFMIYGNNAGAINQTALGIGTAIIGPNAGFYRVEFSVTINIPAGPFWVSIDHRNLRTHLSNLTTGTAVLGYERPNLLGGAWTRSSIITRPAFKLYCENSISGSEPIITALGVPRTGTTISLHLSNTVANSAAFLTIGLSATSSSAGPLPFSLETLGAPNCSLLTSYNRIESVAIDSFGAASSNLAIPNSISFLATRLYAQHLVLHPTANPLGIVVSAGINIFIGN